MYPTVRTAPFFTLNVALLMRRTIEDTIELPIGFEGEEETDGRSLVG